MRLPGFSVLQRTPAWLQRRVLFHVWWLESFNRLTRHRLSWRTTTGVLGALGLVAWLAGYWGPSILGLAERHLLSAGVIVALQAAVLTGRSRRAWTEICAQGWLATLPLDQRAWKVFIALRAAVPAAAALVGISTFLVAAAVLKPVAMSIAISGEISSVIGTIVGVLIGWRLPRRGALAVRATSSLLRGRSQSQPGLAALSSWPLLQTTTLLQPRLIARLMVLAIGLPMDVSANAAVALLWTVITGLYLVILLGATMDVASRARKWLQPTPLSFARFAWAVMRYSIIKQLVWTALTVCMLIALGAPPRDALSLADLWLAIVAVLSSMTLASGLGSPGIRVRVLFSICLIAVIETVKQHIALPGALLFSAWQLKRVSCS